MTAHTPTAPRRRIRRVLAGRVAAALVVLALLGCCAPAYGAELCGGADDVPVATTLPQLRYATLCLLNAERAAHGLGALRWSAPLATVSERYALRMVREDFFAHVAPDGSSTFDRIRNVGYLPAHGNWVVGENLACGESQLSTPREVVAAWMASPDHRRNVLEARFDEVGIGLVGGAPGYAGEGVTYTTEFGWRARNLPAHGARRASEPGALRARVPRRVRA
ncbi:MAG: hypothetical protein QOC78_1367 [Solirubrobacteraceae bacterium]|jgi:uncharacterized protein YkwD|nr:hypothetical protein [Solirubrobacteraceae bacterium]